jgi:hypothetical protein
MPPKLSFYLLENHLHEFQDHHLLPNFQIDALCIDLVLANKVKGNELDEVGQTIKGWRTVLYFTERHMPKSYERLSCANKII